MFKHWSVYIYIYIYSRNKFFKLTATKKYQLLIFLHQFTHFNIFVLNVSKSSCWACMLILLFVSQYFRWNQTSQQWKNESWNQSRTRNRWSKPFGCNAINQDSLSRLVRSSCKKKKLKLRRWVQNTVYFLTNKNIKMWKRLARGWSWCTAWSIDCVRF